MTKKPILLSLLLSGCAGSLTALSQDQLSVPEIEPLPSFPQPGYTPAGAGASPLGEPWREPPASVPRSPNKRLLPVDPADPTPGLWAADGPTTTSPSTPRIAEIELWVPDSDTSEFMGRYCALRMDGLLKSEGQMSQTMALLFDDRRCIAARLFQYCWNRELEKASPSPSRDKLEAGLDMIQKFYLHACRNTPEGKMKVEKIFKATTRVWDFTERKRK